MEPSGLGPSFRRLWIASSLSMIGDGAFLTAFPLLAASISHDPLSTSIVEFSLTVPWLVFALLSGALVDRWDRATVMWRTDVIRCLITAGLALAIVRGSLTIAALAVFGFALGTSETLFDTAALSVVPELVGDDPTRLMRANVRLDGTAVAARGFAGPAAGAAGFAITSSLPIIADAASFIASAVLLRSIPRSPHSKAATPQATLLSEIRDGLRWLTHHTELATLAIATATINLATAASTTFLVLYLRRSVHAGTVSYTIILISAAVGALVANLIADRNPGRLEHPFVLPGAIASIGLALITIGAVPNTFAIAVSFTTIGLAGSTWNTVTLTTRQRLIPPQLAGRIHSVYRLLAYGATPIGALAGGLAARHYGLAVTFLGSGCILLGGAVALDHMQRRRSRTTI